MSRFISKIQDYINHLLPSYATVAVHPRGLVHHLDPLLSGRARFAQKSGASPALLTPQSRGRLLSPAIAGQRTLELDNALLSTWLRQGQVISVEFGERHVVEDVVETPTGLRIMLDTPLLSPHDAGVVVQIEQFTAFMFPSRDGGGSLSSPPVRVASEFILVPGDVVEVDGARYVLTRAQEVAIDEIAGTRTYECSTDKIGGFVGVSTGKTVRVDAKTAYESNLIVLPSSPQGRRPALVGPFAYDWVSGPLHDDVRLSPESRVFVQSSRLDGVAIDAQNEIVKNSTESRVPIRRDQMLFWQVVEGGLNWDGSYTLLQAYKGRAHLHGECTPPMNPAPEVVKTITVPTFIPRTALVTSRSLEKVRAVSVETGAEIAETTRLLDGVISVVNSSSTLYGVGTKFTEVFEVGDEILIESIPASRVVVLAVVNDDEIVLTEPYSGEDVVNSRYRRVNYTFYPDTGQITFAGEWSGQEIRVHHRPRLDWNMTVESDVGDIEVSVKVGEQDLQVFHVQSPGIQYSLNILTDDDKPISDIHVTARRVDGSVEPFSVKLSDWQQRGSGVQAIRYWILSDAKRDYGWASSGLLAKSLWYNIDILRPFLDGDGSLAKRLDHGFLLG